MEAADRLNEMATALENEGEETRRLTVKLDDANVSSLQAWRQCRFRGGAEEGEHGLLRV